MSGRFHRKVALVTGAASGIGAAIARRFASEGAQVGLLDVQVPAGRELAGDLGQDRAVFVECDVTDPERLNAAVEGVVGRFGGLDILVNNAGMGAMGNVVDLAPSDWHRIIALLLDATFYGGKYAIPHIRKRGGGTIINIASVSGLFGDRGLAAYNAGKGGIVNLTRAMALDHAAEGIRVNAISPGFINTPVFSFAPQEFHDAFHKVIPMHRSGTAEEVAGVAAFLASDDASYVTGTNIVVDGGLTISTRNPLTS